MTTLWLVRHGETEWNDTLRIQGHTDISLNDRGRWQAERAAETLRNRPFVAAFASDLQRSWLTAQAIVGENRLEVQPRPELREASFGLFEGLNATEIAERYPEQQSAWLADRVHVAPPGGENLLQIAGRVQGFLDEVQSGHPGQQEVLVVAHSGPLRTMLCLLLQMDLHNYWRLRLDNGSITLVDLYPEGAIVSRLNDVCHLGQATMVTKDKLSQTLGIRKGDE